MLTVIGVAAAAVIGLAVFATQLIASTTEADPVGPVVTSTSGPSTAPLPTNADWVNFPGSAYRDDAEVLAGASAEEIRDTGDAIINDYRDELSDELGFTWTQEYDGTFERDLNGYGEESMLYYYESGSWLGEASATTPQARQQIMDAFERITAQYGIDDFYRANDVYDPPESISSFGAEKVEDQALWRFSSRGDHATVPLRVGSSSWDRTIPTDSSFTDASGFYLEDGANGKLYVVVNAYAYALLGENDRDAFVEAMKPYEGLTKPDSN